MASYFNKLRTELENSNADRQHLITFVEETMELLVAVVGPNVIHPMLWERERELFELAQQTFRKDINKKGE